MKRVFLSVAHYDVIIFGFSLSFFGRHAKRHS